MPGPPGERGAAGRRERTVRTRLILIALSVALPAALALGLAALEGWRTARERTDTMLRARAEALANGVARELALVRAMLEALATSPALAGGDLAAFHTQTVRATQGTNVRIVLTAPDGRVLVNSRVPWGTTLPPRGDQDIVRQVFATGESQVSDLYTGPMTGEHLVSVDVPVRGPDGTVLYDLNIGFIGASISRALVDQRLPATWRATVLDGKGVLVARSHGTEHFAGRMAAPQSLEAIRAGINPFETTAQEGLAVRGAHAPVPGTRWTAVVVVPQEELARPLRAALITAAATGGGLLLLGLSLALWQGRRLTAAFSALAAGADALGRGEVAARPPRGVVEASRVGAALSRAAGALAEREAERADADRRQAILINELNHRVKNTLATVQAIAAQTLRREQGEGAQAFTDLDHRLRALARAHDLLVAGTWSDTPLPRVVRAALAPWTEAGRIRIACHCGRILTTLRPAQAQALVLALHELATNAAKYGAISTPEGVVSVTCAADRDGARVEWVESGGPRLDPGVQPRRGFGTRLLERALPRELGARSQVSLHFEPEGLRAVITIGSALQEPAEPAGADSCPAVPQEA
ncbi:sensor histidine kinase [Roseomonas sp. GCM10028921]